MISLIRVQNFKSIKNHWFPLRNLNLVLGLNGMGKTSFIQSLLLLRQSNGLSKGDLRLNGDYVVIGKGRDAFYQYSKTDEIRFEIEFSDQSNYKFDFDYVAEADYLKTKELPTLQDTFFKQSLFTDSFQYVAASRIDPRVIYDTSYTSVMDLNNIGQKGEFTAHYLHVFGNTDIKFPNMKHPKSSSLILSEQVNHWMGEISPGIKFNTTEIQNSDNILVDMQFEQPSLGFTNRFRPTNVGFGISYALPIVTALLSSSPGKLIILENPESHIHPRGQTELGKLIALASMNDIQVIVETHSDHVINGVRVATKGGDISSDKVILFYFQKKIQQNEQFSTIDNIEIDKSGELSHYPTNLLEEWSNQLIKLV